MTQIDNREPQSKAPEMKELVPLATSRNQIKACADTIGNILQRNTNGAKLAGQTAQRLVTWEALVSNVLRTDTIADDKDIAGKIVKKTTALLDESVFSGMPEFVSGNHILPNTSYYREYGINPRIISEAFNIDPKLTLKMFVMTPEEKRKVLEKMEQRDNITRLPSLEDYIKYTDLPSLERLEELISVTKDQSADEITSFSNEYSAIINQAIGLNQKERLFRLGGKQIVIPFTIGSVAGFFFSRYSHEVGREQISAELNPLSQAPIQDLWYELLNRGISLFPVKTEHQQKQDGLIIDAAIDEHVLREQIYEFGSVTLPPGEKDIEFLQRKHLVWSNISENEKKKLEDFLRKHKEHMGRILGREHNVFGKPEVSITRSGVNANDIAIRSVAESHTQKTGNRAVAYIMPGWYYENKDSIATQFTLTDNKDDANVYFINCEPSSPNLKFPNGYIHARDELIREVIQKARMHPDKPYYLTIDKTTNLLLESFSEGEDMPENLIITETASLSKHQRGGKNYFYGVVLQWGNEKQKQILQEETPDLTPLSIIHLPRLTRGEIAANMAKLSQVKESFASALAKIQEDLPQGERWRLEAYNYYAYLLPPIPYVLDQIDLYKARMRANGVGERRIKMNIVDTITGILDLRQKTLLNEIEEIITEKPIPGVELGDSFGLGTTRLVNLPGDAILDDPYYRELRLRALRISYGSETKQKALDDLVTMINPFLEERMDSFTSRLTVN